MYFLSLIAILYTIGSLVTFPHVSYNMYLAYKKDADEKDSLSIDYFIIYISGATVAWPVYWFPITN